ncbi:ATP-binding protein [Chloroflexota bacterium]
MNNAFEITIEARLENLEAIGEFVTNCMQRVGADARSTFEVQLVVDEACTNIVQYAYGDEGGTIGIRCQRVGDDFIVSIRDRGKPFDPNSVAPPDVDAALGARRIGGLGIYFMHRMMDEVSYTFDPDKGNELSMRKRLTQE